MNDRTTSVARAPRRVRIFGRILQFLLAVGVPLGPNRLITIPGRRSGLPRTTALAVIPISGGRWVWAPWGEVNWVRNLRAAGRATITWHNGKEEILATELNPSQRLEFFRDTYAPFVRRIPFGIWFVRIVDGVDVADPLKAAEGTRVFELHPLRAAGDPRTT
jgi:deazaflavin-dependent oxidoreductase (nitroreductase family)